MFKSIFQNPQNLETQFQQLIKTIQANDSQSDALLVQIIEYQSNLINLKAQHWKLLYQLVLAIFNKANIYNQFIQKKTQLPRQITLFKIIDALRDNTNYQAKFEYLVDLQKVYTNPEAQLLIEHEVIFLLESIETKYQRLYPLILRMNAFILQQYINIKKEKASSDKDKLENEIILFIHCERWIQDILLKFFETLSRIIKKKNDAKRYFINFGCDVIEALLQNILEGVLNFQILNTLLHKIEHVFIQNYNLHEILENYIQKLKINHMNHPVKVLEVVQVYDDKMLYNANGVCYIIFRFVSKSKEFKYISTKQSILKVLIPALSESLKRSLPYKYQLLQLFYDYTNQQKINIISNNQFNYPISKLLVSLLQQNREKSNKLIQQILNNITVDIKVLEKMILDNSSHQHVQDFVIERLIKIENLSKSKRILSKLNFREKDQQFNINLLKIYENIKEKWVSQIIQQKKSTTSNSQIIKKLQQLIE